MEMQVESVGTTTVNVAQNPVIAEPTYQPGNFQADIAAIAAKEAAKEAAKTAPIVPAPQAEVPKVQPETTATAPVIAPEVPEKFKAEDGSLDTVKLEKSTADGKAALDKYLAMEKELRRTMNNVSGLKNQAPQIMAQTEAAPANSTFAAQLEADMAKYGAGAVLERLFEASKEAAKAEAKRDVLSDLQTDREERLERKSREELSEIAKHDQGVLTPEGLEALARIRAERPWIEKAANPTSEAYKVYLADQVMKARQQGTVLPTPTGLATQPKAVPVGPAPRAVVKATEPVLETMEQIEAHLKGMDTAQKAAFYASKGFNVARFK